MFTAGASRYGILWFSLVDLFGEIITQKNSEFKRSFLTLGFKNFVLIYDYKDYIQSSFMFVGFNMIFLQPKMGIFF